MIIIYICCALISFSLFVWAFLRYSPSMRAGPLPSHFFIFFMALAWSPLCFFPIDKTHIAQIPLSLEGQSEFAATYSMMYIFVSIGFVFSSGFIRRNKNKTSVRVLTNYELARLSKVVTLGSLVFVFGYLMSSELRQHLSDVWSYASATNILSYTELRRELTSSGLVMSSIHGRAQYSIIAFFFVSIVLLAIRKKKLAWAYLLLATVLFVVCAVTFKKRPYLYFFAMACATFIIYNRSSFEIRPAFFIKILVGIAVAFSILILLYGLQYKDNSYKDLADHVQTLYFRVFSAYPAGYKLYLDIYPSELPFTYGKDIGMLQPFWVR